MQLKNLQKKKYSTTRNKNSIIRAIAVTKEEIDYRLKDTDEYLEK